MDRATVKGHASSSRSFLPGTRQPEVAHPTDVQIPLVPMRTVKSGLKGLRTLEKVALARNAVKGISGNAAFPTPTPAMAVVTGAADKLETAYNNALIGGPAELELRRVAESELDSVIAHLCLYVNTAAAGDPAVAVTSNFPLIKQRTPTGKLPAPANAHARLTDFAGQVDLKWDAVEHARYYHAYICSTDPSIESNWSLVGISSRSGHTVVDLTGGKYYWFRITAVGTVGEGAASDVVMKRAA